MYVYTCIHENLGRIHTKLIPEFMSKQTVTRTGESELYKKYKSIFVYILWFIYTIILILYKSFLLTKILFLTKL